VVGEQVLVVDDGLGRAALSRLDLVVVLGSGLLGALGSLDSAWCLPGSRADRQILGTEVAI
jgi:hypothetical protein